jgi:hypothetical protein
LDHRFLPRSNASADGQFWEGGNKIEAIARVGAQADEAMSAIDRVNRDVRYWHKADIDFDEEHVCFRG